MYVNRHQLPAIIERTSWHISTQLESPSNYDRRIVLDASDVQALLQAAKTLVAVGVAP